mgnify:CR=1 FL=1
MFAVIKTGGKQYKVQEGDTLSVEKLEHTDNNVIFDQVLLLADTKDIKVGKPLVQGVKVEAKVLEDGKGKKKRGAFSYMLQTESPLLAIAERESNTLQVLRNRRTIVC